LISAVILILMLVNLIIYLEIRSTLKASRWIQTIINLMVPLLGAYYKRRISLHRASQ
jgi:ABC-type protease/lipase transport system fused ATPase/permease subunit